MPAATVQAGDRISVKASGTCCYGVSADTNEPLCGSPDGICPPSAAEPLLVQTSKFGTLVAKIGDGRWFAVGSSHEWIADRSGLLTMAFNDRADGTNWWMDNSGAITIELRIN
jgi:hypothetical protein